VDRIAAWLMIAFLVLTAGGCGLIGLATVADARNWTYSLVWLVVLLPAGLLCLAGAGVLWILARLRTRDRPVPAAEPASAGGDPAAQATR